MLRDKGLTEKILLLGIDGMDPRFSKKMVDEGKMPHLKKMIEQGAARQDLMLLGGMPTITPPMWTTLASLTTISKSPANWILLKKRFIPNSITLNRCGTSPQPQAKKPWSGTGLAALGLLPATARI